MITATYNMFTFNRVLNSPPKGKDPALQTKVPKLGQMTESHVNNRSYLNSTSSRRSGYPAEDIQQRPAEFLVSNNFMYVPKGGEFERTLTHTDNGQGSRRHLLEESALEIKTSLRRLYARGKAMGLQEQEMVKYIMRHAFECMTDSETDDEEILYPSSSRKSRARKAKRRPLLSRQEWDLIKVFPSNWRPARKGEGMPPDFILAWFNFRLQKIGFGLWKEKSRRWEYVRDLYGIGTIHGCWVQRD